MDQDLCSLKDKVDCGVDVLISQLFFDNELFYEFRDKGREMGIKIPIVAGIMPITSQSQIDRMVSMCGASVPEKVHKMIRAFGHNSMAMKEAGLAYATSQIVDLLSTGVDGIHLYTMNKPYIAEKIYNAVYRLLAA